MNIIEAWHKAKYGEIITYKHNDYNYWVSDKDSNDLGHFVDWLKGLGATSTISNDWEIKKKPMVWEGEVMWNEYKGCVYPYDINREDFIAKMNLLGKRTKIRIEEIVE